MDHTATTDRQSLRWSYLLLGILLVLLTWSFFSAWAWSSESWFRIGIAGGGNSAYSPGALIPLLVLLMIGAQLRRLPPTPGVAKHDWFNAAFEAWLWPVMTAMVRRWHHVRGIEMTEAERRQTAYKYRAVGVWALWGVLAGAMALVLTAAWKQPAFRPPGLFLLFVNVLVFSAAVLYVGWRRFNTDPQAQAAARRWTSQAAGLAILVLCLVLHFAAVRSDFNRISIMAFLGCLLGMLWYFYGWRVARCFIFPLAFMIFTLPMEWIEDRFGITAQMFATRHSVSIMGFLGIHVEKVAETSFNILKANEVIRFNIAAPCSGLKSLVALSAISATYGYLTQKTMPKMLLVMACGPALAVVANVIRLVGVGVVAQFSGRGWAMFFHDHALPIYILAILLLMGLDKLINSKWLRIEDF